MSRQYFDFRDIFVMGNMRIKYGKNADKKGDKKI